MRRLITLLAVALSLLLVTAVVPAAAKRPPQEPPEPAALYDVTFQIAGEEDGLEEDGLGMCAEPEPQSLTMVELVGSGASGSALVADGTEGTFGTAQETSEPRLYLRAGADVPADRNFVPDGFLWDNPDKTFDGCHGGALDGSELPDVPSYFVIHSDRSGIVTNVLWAFDLYKTEGTKRHGKTPGVDGVKEYFRLWGTDVSFQDGSGNGCPLTPTEPVTTCHVSGSFEVWHYYPIERIGTAEFDFTLTIAPHIAATEINDPRSDTR